MALGINSPTCVNVPLLTTRSLVQSESISRSTTIAVHLPRLGLFFSLDVLVLETGSLQLSFRQI